MSTTACHWATTDRGGAPRATAPYAGASTTHISLPEPLERAWQRLVDHLRRNVPSAFGVGVTVLVAFHSQRRRHVLVGQHPVVQRRLFSIGAEVVLGHVHPDPNGLHG